jgi:aminoglycoside 6-adenylyltransferase
MLVFPDEAEVLEKLVAWGEAHPSIRAILLTSSRAKPDGGADAVGLRRDPRCHRRRGLQPKRRVAVGLWPADGPLGRPVRAIRLRHVLPGVVYENGVKIDYSIWPDALLERVSEQTALPEELDLGYRVLLDKDGRTTRWLPPTLRAYIPTKPAEAEYRALVEEFWWGMTYRCEEPLAWRSLLHQVRARLRRKVRLAAPVPRMAGRDRP